MSGVDSRIVTMKFDNKQFEQNAATTMGTLDKLKSSLSFSGASKGLDNLAASTSGVEGGITKISAAFVGLGAVAVTAISNITTSLMGMAKQQLQSLSGIEAMRDGFSDYELKVGATQTIMAGTGAGIGEVTKSLKDLDIYADETIYRLSDMTSNIGKFTNAGVKLPVAVNAMKGIANVAALSGASAEEASRAMYNLGQSIGQGTVKLMDWKSVELANMGTKEFKEQLIDSAVAAGTLTKGLDGTMKTAKGTAVNFKTFSSTLSEGWLTSKALTDTLGNYADKTTDIGKKAYKAATEVKTFSMMMETLKAAAGTGWTDTFETVIGTLPEATKLFTGMTNAIGGVIGASADARNNLLKDWKELGGRKDLIKGFKNIFGAIGDVLGPIREAFREIFPPTTGKQLADITEAFKKFAKGLRLSDETMANLKATFKGIFAVFSIVKQAVFGVVGVIFDLVGAIGSALGGVGGGGILGFTAKIGDFISGIDEAIKKGSLFTNFFDKVSKVLVPAVAAIAGFGQALFALATGQSSTFLDDMTARFESLGPIIDTIRGLITSFASTVTTKFNEIREAMGFGDKLESGVGEMKSTLGQVPGFLDRIKAAWSSVKESVSNVGDFLAPMIASLKNAFSIIQQKIAEFVKDMGIEEALALINTGFFIALYMALKSFVKKMGGLVDQMGGMFESAGGVLNQVTSNLKTMQADIKANIILKIAAALALLTASIVVLSRIDTVNLGKSLLAVALLLKMMTKALDALDSDDSTIKSTTKMTILSAALIGLGLAVLTFSAAVAVLGNMDTATLIRGITAIGAILGIVIAATALLNKSGGAGAMAVAAIGILALSVALTAFAGALKLYSMLDTGMMLEGGLKIVASLAAIALVMKLMPPGMLVSALALIILSQALVIIAAALKALGSLSVEEMAKSITMLGLSLLIIAIGLNAMSGAIGGAAALMLFAVALGMLVPPLVMLGNLELETLGKALLALVGIFVVFAAAGILMGPLVPVLFALAGAMALVGLAAIAIGAGLFLFATGLGVLAASGAAGAAVLVGVVISIAQLFPLIMHQIGLGIIAFAKVIGDGAPVLVEALTKLIKALLKQAETLIPLLPPIISKAITAFLKVIKDNQPKFIQAGLDWIMAIITGLANNVGKLAKKAGDLIIAFLDAWATEYPRMADAGAKALIKFMNGMSTAIDNNSAEMGAAGGRLGIAIIKGMAKGITGSLGVVKDAAIAAGKAALNAAKSFLGIASPSKEFEKIGEYTMQGFADGIVGGLPDVEAALSKMRDMLADAVQKTKDDVDAAKARLKDLSDDKPEQGKSKRARAAQAAHRERIKEAKAELAAAKEARAEALAAQKAFEQTFAAEQQQLLALGARFDDVSDKLKKATDELKAATDARDNAAKGFTGQYSVLPELTKETSLEKYKEDLQKSIIATRKFKETLDALRALGMDDATYNKFLAKGTDAQPFLEELLASGAGGISELNQLDSELASIAGALGQKAAADLYQTGVDAAQGLVNGLSSELAAIEGEMTRIGNAMIAAINKALGIASPSKQFAKVGRFANEGLAKGLKEYSSVVGAASEDVGIMTMETLKETMDQIAADLALELNTDPVIKPVLDLSKFQSDASKMNALFGDQALAAKTSYRQASTISQDSQQVAAAMASVSGSQEPSIVFEQNNFSPTALSAAAIYRQTKNQLSLAKEALTL